MITLLFIIPDIHRQDINAKDEFINLFKKVKRIFVTIYIKYSGCSFLHKKVVLIVFLPRRLIKKYFRKWVL